MLCQTLSLEIKCHLRLGWKYNPDVCIELKIDEDVYQQTLKKLDMPVKGDSGKGGNENDEQQNSG